MPRAKEFEFLTRMEEAPKGMLACGSYKCHFTDDKTDHLFWEWNLSIKKDSKSWAWPRRLTGLTHGGMCTPHSNAPRPRAPTIPKC